MNDIEIKCKLLSIREISFDAVSDQSDYSEEKLEVKFSIQTSINAKKELIDITTSVSYMYDGRDLLNLTTSTEFVVDSLFKYLTVDVDNKKFKLEVNIMPTFLTASVGALRGILSTKVAETQLSKFPLPLISMEALEKNNRYVLLEAKL